MRCPIVVQFFSVARITPKRGGALLGLRLLGKRVATLQGAGRSPFLDRISLQNALLTPNVGGGGGTSKKQGSYALLHGLKRWIAEKPKRCLFPRQ